MKMKFGQGSIVKQGDITYRVISYRPKNAQIRLEDEDGKEIICNTDDFNTLVAQGHFQVSYYEHESLSLPFEKRFLTASERMELDRRLELLQVFDEAREQGYSAKASMAFVIAHCQQHRYLSPSPRTIQRWKALESRASDKESLAPRLSQRGRRSKIFQLGVDSIGEVALDAIMKYYCETDKFSYAGITLLVNRMCMKYANQHGLEFEGVSKRTVVRQIKLLSKLLIAPGQVDKATFHQEMRTAIRRFFVERPYERVEIDATSADLFLRDDSGSSIGRATIYAGIDAATAHIISLIISIRKPSEDLVLKVFQFAFAPKDEAFHQKYNLKNQWPAPAAIETVVLDNAQEHHGSMVLSALRYLGITVDYPQAGKPQAKPFIERFFGVLKTRLINACPGSICSQSKLEKEPYKKAEAQNLLTTDEFEALVIRWVTDVYHQTPIPRLEERFGPGCTPAKAMKILKSQYGALPPPNLQQFTDACWSYRKKTRTLRHDGIPFDGLQFHSDELGRLYREIGKDWKVEVRYNPLDCSVIQVVDPRDDQNLIEAFNKNTFLSVQSFADAKYARSNSRRSDGEVAGAGYAISEADMLDELDAKKKSKKMRERNQAACKQDALNQAKNRPRKKPPTSATQAPGPTGTNEPLTAAPRRRKGAAQ
ncbi:TPA: transposase [Pseudomonas aeruginosa]|uniref:Mu transposase C-terminal domain-containing protein n=1 Tax=Pseudomonas aeruginosa TaxID=287 RepID=UPI001CC1A401|nr:Mu transposase C-terminal domain-containing protein [Pseudomonas aeruginosa]HBO2993413.1 transposase [Pseudomonas aeruginosa]HBO5656565.1 transposase [Pseudomonas aeruginosa]HCI1863528.1 transposase [Pseudomonas aeruginosa]HCI2647554.1 transposase [Pseudomonas aeruginosa]